MDAAVTESAGTPAESEPAADSNGTRRFHGNDAGAVAGARAEADEDAPEAPDAPEDEAPAEAGSAAGGSGGGASTRPAGAGRRRRRRWVRWVAGGVGFVVLATAGTGWWLYKKLNGNITADTNAAAELQTYEKDRPTPVALDALNVLLIGSDTRTGKGDGKFGGGGDGTARSDTTILLHLAADRKSATAVSIPRDLMVHIPSCGRPDGSHTQAQFAQFNWAYSFGGTACTTRTVENLTGVRIDHEMVVDFNGFKDMVDAVGGVDVCLAQPVDDKDAHLKLSAGKHLLNGTQALGYVRSRHGIGDGSDTERITRQQGFLGALFKKVQSDGVLLNPTRLYPVLDAATKAITTDPGLASLRDLYNLVHSMQSVPTDKVQFLTVPVEPYAPDPNRDALVTSKADKLFTELRDDTPVTVQPSGSPSDSPPAAGSSGASPSASPGAGGPSGGTGSSGSPALGVTPATPAPTFTGTNASVGLCS
jgi:LCP family protein required for cell wall assembly